MTQTTLTQPDRSQQETLDLLEWSRLCQHLATFAATKLGAIAARNLQIPTTQGETLQLLAQTREVYTLENQLASGLQFTGIQDIGDALERSALQGILSGEELLEIATTLAGARNLRRTIENQDNLPTLTELVAELRTYPEIEQEIYRCIDDRGKVTERASPKLADIREKIRSTRDRIYSILQKMLSRHGNAIQEPVITQRDGRFVIPVKAPQKDAIPGIVHDASMSGATLYVEPQSTVQMNNALRQLLRQEQAEEEAVRRKLTEQVAAVQEDLEALVAICTRLDLATARARYSFWLEANPPRFIDWGEGDKTEPIVLRNLRHPLLIWQQQHEQGREVVPIHLTIDPQIRVVAITGPNTGGKTVTLKTLALAVLMAKVGLFVPAREPVELPWFSQVLADIGDEQSLQQSLSTFSGHIRRIGRILNALAPGEALPIALPEALPDDGASDSAEESQALMAALSSEASTTVSRALSNSLVLLDEVGAGTDPSEGSALAIALLKHLADHTKLTIATTHFGELKALKYQDDRFENASVEFDDVSLSPTYRLLWGIPGRSNALTIARRLGLQDSVVDAAQTYVGGLSQDINDVIAGLEAQRREQETKAKEADRLIKQAEFFYEQVTAKAQKLKERERELKQAQEDAVQKMLLDAKSQIAQVIKQLQKGTPTAQDAQAATEQLQKVANRHLPSAQPKQKPGFQPKVGDRVRIPRLGQTAEVLAVDEEDLTVRFGIMKMTISIYEIESLQGQKVQREEKPKENRKAEPTPPPLAPAIRTESNTFDIRGSRVADAEITIDRAISAAQGPIWIIHGHGTGKLRQGVHEFLKQHHRVAKFEAAEKHDGGSGVTVVYPR
ncbi:endonuclease MutS2 [Alkalinema pantanalense]|uniref:endonuclease MutS2 n=1 Tax=Alkalinema pantanalense TaxID=1620705 RepID=UPI003D6EBE31